MFLEIFQNSSLVESIALSLLHSVWQIALVSFLLFLVLRLFPVSKSTRRYTASVIALIICLLAPVITFIYISQFPFHTSNKHIIIEKSSARLLQEKTEKTEEYIAEGQSGTVSADLQKTSVVANLQNDLEQTFSVYSPFLVSFWLIGMLLFSLRLAGGFWKLHQYKTRKTSAPDLVWQDKFSRLCEKLKIRQKVRLLQSNLVASPMVIGWIKPVILVPASVFLQMDPRQLETILAHELMHIRRFDYLVNFAQSFIEILFFYHPCIWWISGEIRRERECACDDAVLQTLENSQFTYANALANLEGFRMSAKQNKPHLNVAANGGKLMNRIERIVKKETARRSRFQNSLWPASLASMLILAFMVNIFWANSSPDVNNQKNWNYNSERKMAVGFVAIPPNYKKGVDAGEDETVQLLIEKLQKFKIPAVGFVQGSRMVSFKYKDSVRTDLVQLNPQKADILRMWRDAGLEIGIGNFGHQRFYDSDYDEYVAEARTNIETIRPIMAEKGQKLRYFSYPYLNTGKDIESKTRFEQWLRDNNLTFIPYTFDNQEWLYSYAYDVARKQNNPEMMKQVKQDFLEYMKKMVVHYEGYSNDLFQREIPQTLVLTTSRLVADSADELFGMFKDRGYEFVAMNEALEDEAYAQTETFTGRAGISWMERWTITQGNKLREEPKVSNEADNIWRSMNKDRQKAPIPPPPPVPSMTPPPPPPAPPKPPKPPKEAPPSPPKPPKSRDGKPAPPPPPAPPAPDEPKPPRAVPPPPPPKPPAPVQPVSN